MKTINITKARANLYELTDQVVKSHEPMAITNKSGAVVMVEQEDFEALMETVYLQQSPEISAEARAVNNDEQSLFTRDKLEW